MTYAWQGFPHEPILGSGGTVDRIGNAVFATGAIVLLARAARASRRAAGGKRDADRPAPLPPGPGAAY